VLEQPLADELTLADVLSDGVDDGLIEEVSAAEELADPQPDVDALARAEAETEPLALADPHEDEETDGLTDGDIVELGDADVHADGVDEPHIVAVAETDALADTLADTVGDSDGEPEKETAVDADTLTDAETLTDAVKVVDPLAHTLALPDAHADDVADKHSVGVGERDAL
jgi:hypothetical protein